jgi:hypothetical protein
MEGRTFYITKKKYKCHLHQIAEMVQQESDAFPNKKLRTISSVSSGKNTISALHYSAMFSALSAECGA